MSVESTYAYRDLQSYDDDHRIIYSEQSNINIQDNYYYENNSTQIYTYDEEARVIYSEYSGNMIDNNSSHDGYGSNSYSYDEVGRLIQDISYWTSAYDSNQFSNELSTRNLSYIDSSTKKLLQLEELREYASNDYQEDSTLIYTYDYSGRTEEIWDGQWDYSTRWGIETRNYKSEWMAEQETTTRYTKHTQTNQGQKYYNLNIVVQTNDQEIIIHSNISEGSSGHNSSSNLSTNSSDWDNDGKLTMLASLIHEILKVNILIQAYGRMTTMVMDMQIPFK